MSKATILIVEDEAIVAADLAGKLGQLGYEISGATATGEEAVALARRLRPNLILMDIHLTGRMDGIEAAERIRQECALPVIYLTAHSDRATLERAKLTEPFGYILKPFEELDLETHIQMALYKHEAENKLRESESRIRAAFENASVPMALIALDHVVLKVNEAFCQMMSHSATELEGHSLFEITHPEDQPLCRAGHEKVISGEMPSFRMEERYIRKDGRIVWGDMSTASVRDAKDQPLYLVSLVQDITGRKKAEAALRASEQALQNANEKLQVVNEELRVTNETLELRVAARTAELQQRTHQLQALAGELTRAEDQERRRVALVIHDHLQQLLVGARFNIEIVRGQLTGEPLTKELDSLMGVLNESLEATRTLTAELSPPILYQAGLSAALKWLARWYEERHGLIVRVDAEEEADVAVEEVRVTLFRAVRELLFNAVKHAHVKTASVRLSRMKDGEVRIVVSDAGKGFDPAEVRTREGTDGGFGLFNLRERIELLGGKLNVESAPGKGCRFTLQAPIAPPAPIKASVVKAPRARQAKKTAVTATGKGRKIRILLADDHAIVRDGLARSLSDKPDFEVVGEAANGQEALDLARRLQPDLVIMDVSMPKMDGITATGLLTAELPRIKVIGLSMFNDDSHKAAMGRAGAVCCTDKAGPAALLFAAIRKHAGVSAKSARKAG